MDLDDYQQRANETDKRPGQSDEALVFPLMGLASEVGSLVNQYKKRVRDGDAHALFSERAAEELGDVLWYVANLATKLGLDLDEVAELNLRRIAERWPVRGATVPAALFDDGFPAEEQLPRQLAVHFEEVEADGATHVQMRVDGKQIGNDLSDMNYDDDGYRFHDVFHLGFAAMLGWSPLVRLLLGIRRESDKRVRVIEDGGRAIVIEEAISALAFDYARNKRFLEGVPHLDYELLRTIRGLVSHLEVRVRTAAEWERAILSSFKVWRELRDRGCGVVYLNLSTRNFDFERLE